MHRECRERFPRGLLQRKPLVSDPGMHHGTCDDACRDRVPAVAGKTFPTYSAYAHPQFYVSDKRPMAVEDLAHGAAKLSATIILVMHNNRVLVFHHEGFQPPASSHLSIEIDGRHKYTVRCRYNAVNFLQNPHNRHPIARPWGWGMGCLLWL